MQKDLEKTKKSLNTAEEKQKNLEQKNQKTINSLNEKLKKYETIHKQKIDKELQKIDIDSKKEKEELDKINVLNDKKLEVAKKSVEKIAEKIRNNEQDIKNKTNLLDTNINLENLTTEINRLKKELKSLDQQIQKLSELSNKKVQNSISLSNAEQKQIELLDAQTNKLKELETNKVKLQEIKSPNKKEKKELNLINEELSSNKKYHEKKKIKKQKTFDNAKNIIVKTLDNFIGTPKNTETLGKIIEGIGDDKKGKIFGQVVKLTGSNIMNLVKLGTYIPYLKEEGERIPKILKGEEKYNSDKKPFYVELLQDKDLPNVLNKNKQNIVDLAVKLIEMENVSKVLKPLGIKPELIKKAGPNAIDLASSAIPIAGKIAENLIKSPLALSSIYTIFQVNDIRNIILNGSQIVTNLSPILDKDLPEFLNKNKDNITNIAKESLAITPVKEITDRFGITSDLVDKIAPNVIDIASSSLPLVNNIAQNFVKTPELLSGMYNDF